MKLTINGEPRDSTAATLAALLEAEGLATARVATALNGQFVAAALRTQTALSPGDAVEIVAPMQGG